MATIPVRKSKAPRKRVGKGAFITEEHDVFEGRAKVIRTYQSGDVWQFRAYIPDNQKYVRKSLRTKFLDEAMILAENEYIKIQTKVASGEVLFERDAKELIDLYVKHRERDVKLSTIKPSRLETICSQLKHLLYFAGEEVKLSSIKPDKFEEYYTHRKTYAPNVQNVTLINEVSTINSFYNFCFSKKYLHADLKPQFLTLSKKQADKVSRRDTLTKYEMGVITHYLKDWHNNSTSPKEIEQKKFIKWFVMLLSLSGIRFGEARLLRWRNIIRHKGFLQINIEEGKTGARSVISDNSSYISSLKRLSKHTKRDDFLFVDNDTGEPIKKDVYYKLWKEMLKRTGLIDGDKHIVYYNLRHYYCTSALYRGVNIYILAQNMGCSVNFIEQHYGHLKVVLEHKELTKPMPADKMEMLNGDDKHVLDTYKTLLSGGAGLE